jgi:SpoVK/Ycf46/Vps4 family AAA+-type ATPase
MFREAAKSGGILFFDEADAIFGKRGEQKDSHDRYANMQTSFLLQRFEAYDGIVFLATNLQANMDSAYMRRIHVLVDFEKPDAQLRKRMWDRLLTEPLPVSESINTESLAQMFEMTGAEIKNSVMTAAFLAAAQNAPLDNDRIIPAILLEHAKNGVHLMADRLNEYNRYKLNLYKAKE